MLYLSSYKLGNKVEELKKWIEQNNNKIAVIINSKDLKPDDENKELKIKENINDIENIGFKATIIDLKKYFNNKELLDKDLKQFKAFYVIGGNVFALRKAMSLSGFDIFLKDFLLNKENLYIGYSAGMCVLAPKLNGLDIVDNPLNPYNSDDIEYNGLGLVDYVPVPHYKSNHKESELIDEVVEYLNKNNIKYKTFKDGDVEIIRS